MKARKNTKLIGLILISVFFLTAGLGCKGGSKEAKQAGNEDVVIEIWSVFDTKKDLATLFDYYQKRFPNVSFEFEPSITKV